MISSPLLDVGWQVMVAGAPRQLVGRIGCTISWLCEVGSGGEDSRSGHRGRLLAEKVSYIVGAGRVADVGIAGGLRVLWG